MLHQEAGGRPLTLRPRAPADLDALADLWVDSWNEAMPGIDFSARRGWLATRLAALEAAGARTICAVDHALGLIGFIAVDPAACYLDQIAVARAAKGQGVAHLLIDAARALCAGPLRLDVNADNTRAVNFYLREGFAVASEGVNPNSGLKTLQLRDSARTATREGG